jgi:hypothetical protein
MSEAELARDLHAVPAKVRQGVEVIIEKDEQPFAVLKVQMPGGRRIEEVLRDARSRNLRVTLDDNFGNNLEEIIAKNQELWNPPSWD